MATAALYAQTLHRAFLDYSGARSSFMTMCGIPGFISSQQAIEKLLKCWLRAHGANVPSGPSSHDLTHMAKLASAVNGGPMDFAPYADLLRMLTSMYKNKYGDNIPAPGAKPTMPGTSVRMSEAARIDQLAIGIVAALPDPKPFFSEFLLGAIMDGRPFPTASAAAYGNHALAAHEKELKEALGEPHWELVKVAMLTRPQPQNAMMFKP